MIKYFFILKNNEQIETTLDAYEDWKAFVPIIEYSLNNENITVKANDIVYATNFKDIDWQQIKQEAEEMIEKEMEKTDDEA